MPLSGGASEEISDLCGEFQWEGGNYVVEPGPLVSTVTCGKLGFHLGKPDLGVRWLEGWDLDGYGA